MTFTAPTPNDLAPVCDHLLSSYKGGIVVLLRGGLGAGKTTLVKRFAEMMGVSEGAASPTFAIMHGYGERLFHYDLYQTDLEKFTNLGLFEELEKPGFHMVEWGGEELEKMLEHYGIPYVVVTLTPEGDGRNVEVSRA